MSPIVASRICDCTWRSPAAASSIDCSGLSLAMIVRNVMPLLSRNESTAANCGFVPQRQDNVECAPDFRTGEAQRHHADNRERHLVDGQGPADDVGCAIESLLPEAIA